MFSFDLSTTNIILTVAVAGLLMFFIVLLIKLNPSTDKKEKFETEIEPERPEPSQSPILVAQEHPSPRPQTPAARIEAQAPRLVEKPVVVVGHATGGGSAQMREETLAPVPPFKDSREVPRTPERTVTPAPKPATVPARRDCLHHFGYLRTFPKNSPIPDECFGCERIVDCLVDKKSNGKNDRRR